MNLGSTEPKSQVQWEIRVAEAVELPLIREIAEQAWPVAFGQFLTAEFLAHELQRCYSDTALKSLMDSGEQFLLAYAATRDADVPENVGFASWRKNSVEGERSAKLEKLYLRPNLKSRGYGKALLEQVIHDARRAGCQHLFLNVNRENPSVLFYQHMGFSIVRSEDIEVGPGFYRNDYVMARPLTKPLV